MIRYFCFGYQVIAGLWVLSVVGNWCNFLTLFYICKDLFYLLAIFYKLIENGRGALLYLVALTSI